jgi:predicted CxxxxCH...CXXCH cytochrome family protein
MHLTTPTLVIVACLLAGCAVSREQPEPAGAHPAGWANRGPDGVVQTDDPNFHGTWLSANGFPLSQCQQCHGDDFSGGAVGVSCSQSGCHSPPNGPIDCTTCHGSQGTPRPASGAHWAHQRFCDTCHQIPSETVQDVERHASGDASTIVRFGDLAVQGAAPTTPPSWDPNAQVCSNTYCHGTASPAWTSGTQIPCDGCHSAPPSDHSPWARVATTTSSCTTCHPPPTAATHVDGLVEVTVTSCTACHGSNGHANPPLSVDGSTDPTTRGVGAHEAHLDPSFPNRIANPLPCEDCHVVPSSVVQPGHFDQPQAQVVFPWNGQFGTGGALAPPRDAFDTTNATCNVWCHFNRSPDTDAGAGADPLWTDNSGDAVQCNSCHQFPPVTCRNGDTHPVLPPGVTVSVCEDCHVYSNATHVNGVVDFRP